MHVPWEPKELTPPAIVPVAELRMYVNGCHAVIAQSPEEAMRILDEVTKTTP